MAKTSGKNTAFLPYGSHHLLQLALAPYFLNQLEHIILLYASDVGLNYAIICKRCVLFAFLTGHEGLWKAKREIDTSIAYSVLLQLPF